MKKERKVVCDVFLHRRPVPRRSECGAFVRIGLSLRREAVSNGTRKKNIKKLNRFCIPNGMGNRRQKDKITKYSQQKLNVVYFIFMSLKGNGERGEKKAPAAEE